MTNTEHLFSEKDHLLYLDITDICSNSCAFCLHRNHRNEINLSITNNVRSRLKKFINDSKKVGISGEGEPLNNQNCIFDILSLGHGGKKFDLITSTDVPSETLNSFIDKAIMITTENNNTLRLRISVDRFHCNRNQEKNISLLFKRLLMTNNTNHNLELAFRSITTDVDFVKKYLNSIVQGIGGYAEWIYRDALGYLMRIDLNNIEVDFQSIIKPRESNMKDIFTVEEYILLLEKRFKRPFTFGNMETEGKPGLDVTIRPNGDIVFYGLECEKIGNIYQDDTNYNNVEQFIENSPFYRSFILTPFKNIIYTLRKNGQFSKMIDEINNPYWIVREIYNVHPEEIKEIVMSIRAKQNL